MSLLRKRSQDVRARCPDTSEAVDYATAPKSLLSRKTTGTVAACLALIFISAVLIVQVQWHSVRSPSVATSISATTYVATDDPYRLHPEDHAFRQKTTIKQQWRVTSGLRRPDGVLKRVYLINDTFPGPTIECRSGDRLVIQVENALEGEGLSLHWHGLTMRNANEMDGAVGITNNPIPAGDTFIYDFEVEDLQSGTFWYHSHSHLQRSEGLFGPLIVHKPKSGSRRDVDAEHVLAVGDWYHRTAEEAQHFYSHPGSFGNEPVPDSILLNGKGAYNCSDAVPARPLDCVQSLALDLPALMIDGSRRNILRIINAGSYAGVSLSSSSFRFTPTAVDGGNSVIGTPTRKLDLLEPGERVDVLLETTGNAASTMLEISLDTTPFKYPNPALSPTHGFPISGTPMASLAQTQIEETLNLQSLQAAERPKLPFPSHADQTMVLYAVTQRLAHLENKPRGFINFTSWQPQTSPMQPLISMDRERWDSNQLVPKIEYNAKKPQWVDVVLNNLDEEGHPFHLHGYDFWVLATYSSTFNWGSYNPFEDAEPPGGKYNLVNPVRKDTVFVPRRGYAVLRMRADNPGIWLFHCHVMWHQQSGMAMAFDVRP